MKSISVGLLDMDLFLNNTVAAGAWVSAYRNIPGGIGPSSSGVEVNKVRWPLLVRPCLLLWLAPMSLLACVLDKTGQLDALYGGGGTA